MRKNSIPSFINYLSGVGLDRRTTGVYKGLKVNRTPMYQFIYGINPVLRGYELSEILQIKALYQEFLKSNDDEKNKT